MPPHYLYVEESQSLTLESVPPVIQCRLSGVCRTAVTDPSCAVAALDLFVVFVLDLKACACFEGN